MEYFAFSVGDRYVDNDIREAIHFRENLRHLDLKYHRTALRFIDAEQLKELIIHPYVIQQREINTIVSKFNYLKKLSLYFNSGENATLTVSSCFINLRLREEFEIVNESKEQQLNIVLFNNTRNRIDVSRKLKKFHINNLNVIYPDELKLIYRIFPNIEEFGLVKCRLSYRDTIDVLQIVAIGLKKLKNISYTHEYCGQKRIPYSASWIIQHCADIQSIEFNPKVTLDGDFDGVYESFYNSLSSVATMRHFYDLYIQNNV